MDSPSLWHDLLLLLSQPFWHNCMNLTNLTCYDIITGLRACYFSAYSNIILEKNVYKMLACVE